jgi:hypothetical protein
VIVDSANAFGAALGGLNAIPGACSVPDSVFMVMPEDFSVDAESATDNPYMDLATTANPERALAQAVALADLIESVGVPVHRFPGIAGQSDGVFPNNVFATAPGRFIVGSMLHPGRRREAAREDIRACFANRKLIDLSGQDCVAELTGPMIIDRTRQIGFCGMSSRVDRAGLEAMYHAFGLKLAFGFELQPGEYHANVVMSVLVARACVLCPASFIDPAVPDAIARVYPDRTLMLDEAEKDAFAANCIALTDTDLFMSRTGADALRPASHKALQDWGFSLHVTELDELEKAGGSLRCMVAEVF